MRYRGLLGLAVLLASISAGAHHAQAGLRFCNQANFKFSVAVGYVDREKGWVGKGWTVINSGQCKDAITTPLNNRYYYFFAEGRAADREMIRYGGETPFCIQYTKFLLYQSQYGKNSQEECSKAGLLSQAFQKIDVSGKQDFIVNLRGPDGAAQAPGAATAPRPYSPPPNAGPPQTQPPMGQPSTANTTPGPRPAPPPPMNQPSAANTAPRPAQPPMARPSAPAPTAPSAACQRYPNLC